MIIRIYKTDKKKLEVPDVVCFTAKYPDADRNSCGRQTIGKKSIKVVEDSFGPGPCNWSNNKRVARTIQGRSSRLPFGYALGSDCNNDSKKN